MRHPPERLHFRPDEVIFNEGEFGDVAYLITSGRVRVESRQNTLAVDYAELGANEIVGEMSLIDGAPRSATVTAVTETSLVVITRELIDKKLSQVDPVLHLLLNSLLIRLRNTSQRLKQVASPIDVAQPTTGTVIPPSSDRFLDHAINEITLINSIERAIRDDEITLHFQPIVSVANQTLSGFEALLRLPSAEFRNVPLDRVISTAENTGTIVPLGLKILEIGLECLEFLHREQHLKQPSSTPMFLAINVSGRQIELEPQIDEIVRRITDSGASGVKLELTETALLENPDGAERALRQLKQAGILLAFDDFGTGYSSLSYLHRFPLDTLKIDRSFITAIEHDKSSRRIVRAIISLAKELGLDTVAEGVENPAQLSLLNDMGCDHVQGYLIARPLKLTDALQFVRSSVFM